MNDLTAEKLDREARIQQFFNTIAPRYDLTNTVMSWGRHHAWRRKLISAAALGPGQTGLDLCCGTGMVTRDLARTGGPLAQVIGVDFSQSMLQIARSRIASSALTNVRFIQANALDLPFASDSFDCVTTAYGLRNVSDIRRICLEIHRVLKPGGHLAALEMSRPGIPVIKGLYHIYLKYSIPWIGQILAHNKPAYQYLHQSISHFLQPVEIARLLQAAGFENIRQFPLTWGIATLHLGKKTI